MCSARGRSFLPVFVYVRGKTSLVRSFSYKMTLNWFWFKRFSQSTRCRFENSYKEEMSLISLVRRLKLIILNEEIGEIRPSSWFKSLFYDTLDSLNIDLSLVKAKKGKQWRIHEVIHEDLKLKICIKITILVNIHLKNFKVEEKKKERISDFLTFRCTYSLYLYIMFSEHFMTFFKGK